MPRLSVIIPVLQDVARFEVGLVSVLENRPADCQVIAVLAVPYADPYELRGEIEFVEAPRAGLVECLRRGIEAAQAPVVHTLGSGMEVSEGWVEPALARLADPTVAAVAPLVVDSHGSDGVLSTGVQYAAGGQRRVRGRGQNLQAAGQAGQQVLGAALSAGFFRRQALLQVGGLDRAVGDELADVDLALRLRHAGYRTVFEPACRILGGAFRLPQVGPIRQGLYRQRLFWRNAPLVGWWKALLLHPWQWLGDLRKPAGCLRWIGRAAATLQWPGYRRHWRRLAQLQAPAAGAAPAIVPLPAETSAAQAAAQPLRRAG